ncbi:MAG: hypothetical protein RL077_4521 [Verrucomicrobiota bacterium]
MKTSLRQLTALVAVCFCSTLMQAADASGTWKWMQAGRGGSTGGEKVAPRESTLVLVDKAGVLSGKLTTPGRGGDPMSTEISNGKVSGDTISFTVEREYNGNTFSTKYSGKLANDTITGESESPGRDGQSMKREWIAKRGK